MILAIGGPSEEKPGKKPGFMGMKAKKIGGIGGEYANEETESEGPGMDNEEKMLEAARPMAKAMGIPSQSVVEVITTICNLMMNSKPGGEAEPTESEEGEE